MWVLRRACTEYEGHFFPYLQRSATGASLCFALVFFFSLSLFPQFSLMCVLSSARARRPFVCACPRAHFALLFQIDCVYLAAHREQSRRVLTAVLIAGSTWRPTPSPQGCCWWRRCPGTRWARSTRRTCCDASSREATASHRAGSPAEVLLAPRLCL